MSDPDRPDLRKMFFDKNMRRNMRELEFVKALGQMQPQEFISVLTTLLELWSRSAVHHAAQLVEHEPANREAVALFMRTFHRCGRIENFLEVLAEHDYAVDPSQELLDTSIDELHRLVRQSNP